MSASRFSFVPNLIIIARLCLVPVTISMIVDGRWSLAFALFAVAGVSDAIDGSFAKRYDLTTDLGAYLDPAADKALLVLIYVALAIVRVIPSWLATIVVTRDIMIVAASLISRVLDLPVAILPLWISKLNTTAQIAFAGTMPATKVSTSIWACRSVSRWGSWPH